MRPLIKVNAKILLRIVEAERGIYSSILRGEYPPLLKRVEELMEKKRYSDVVEELMLPLAGIPKDSEIMKEYALRVATAVASIGVNAVYDMAILAGFNSKEFRILKSLSSPIAFLLIKGACNGEELVKFLIALTKGMLGLDPGFSTCLGYLEINVPNVVGITFEIGKKLAEKLETSDANVFAEALLLKMIRSLPDEDVYILPIDLTPVIGKKKMAMNATNNEIHMAEVSDLIIRRLLLMTTAYKALEKFSMFNSIEEWNSFVAYYRKEIPSS